ncbi:SepM family pheromone-processing serine protease [Ureibacillus thermosphaericus]|uniref:SepM family pheromone-processing serine protease n=1 Tax=Ureibacillus thermosphaericus TaxID=51173 RepID=UPI001E3B986A|nr:SepM family pheromone-processing serine protease [Ureibacillus thermosphaericus]
MKHFITIIVTMLFLFFLSFYKLDYYIMKPGSSYDVSEFVTVENGDLDDEGTISLMTVAMGPATPLTYLIAKFKEYEDILKKEEVYHKEEDEREYNVRQLKLMKDSQFNAIYVAYNKAGLPYTVDYQGITVLNVLAGGASDGQLEPGDKIQEIDGNIIKKAEDLVHILETKKENDVVQLVIHRNDKLLDRTITLKEIPDSDGKVGLGITYSENKTIKTEPMVKVNAEDIGGPSAGLMFTLEILNQLLEEDITKGYLVAGTGEIHEDGKVGRIGGIEKKVVAAHEDGMEIFFAPDDEIPEEVKKNNPAILSNYEAAVNIAKKLNTDMKIVPVKTIDDALNYLASLPEKDKS